MRCQNQGDLGRVVKGRALWRCPQACWQRFDASVGAPSWRGVSRPGTHTPYTTTTHEKNSLGARGVGGWRYDQRQGTTRVGG